MTDRQSSPAITVIDTDTLRISVVPHQSGSAVLCFSGIGHQIGGVDIQGQEFFNASQNATSIFICDKKRSWGNNLDLAAIAELLAPHTAGKTLYALGNSMGGFIAIVAGMFFDLRSVVAFCPQYSVKPSIVAEDRWQAYINDIGGWRYPSLENVFREQTQYYVFGAPSGKDKKHLSRLPRLPNLHRIFFRDPGIGHQEAKRLKREGLLYPVIADCFNRAAPQDIIESKLALLPEGAYLASD